MINYQQHTFRSSFTPRKVILKSLPAVIDRQTPVDWDFTQKNISLYSQVKNNQFELTHIGVKASLLGVQTFQKSSKNSVFSIGIWFLLSVKQSISISHILQIYEGGSCWIKEKEDMKQTKCLKTLKWCCDTNQVFLIFLYNYNSEKYFHNGALRCILLQSVVSMYITQRKRYQYKKRLEMAYNIVKQRFSFRY